jgi:hypothetical protein
MVVAPVFVADLDTLKEELRLSGIPTDGNSEDLLQQAIRDVRLSFWRKLGDSRIRTIKNWTLVDDPSTNQQYLRHLANQTEIKWVKWYLTWTLPMLFMDDSGDIDMRWNQDPTFRKATSRDLDKLRKELWDEILENLDLLSGDEDAESETSIYVKTFGPVPKPPPIGSSLYRKI